MKSASPALLLVALVLLAPFARAEEEEGPPTDTVVEAELRGLHSAASRIEDDGDARLAITRAFAATSVTFSPLLPLRITLDVDAEHSRYDWHDAEDLPLGRLAGEDPQDPWDDLDRVTMGVNAQLFLSPRWFVILRGGASLGVEPGADVERGLAGGGGAGLVRRFDGSLMVGLTLSAVTQLEGDLLVLPLPFLRWQVTERVRLETAGAGLRATFTPTPGLDLSLRASFESRQWRLADDRAVLEDAVVQDRRVAVGAAASWAPWQGLLLKVEVGVSPYAELEVLDRHGDTERRLRADPAAFVGLGLTLTF